MSGQWRVDPTGRFEYRWWDGDRYTEHVARYGEQLEDPAGIPDPAALTRTIEVGFGSTERQNRWTVGFRIVLAIPHLVWIWLVTVAAVFVLVVGWFAALFTGRLPDGIARFLHQVVQYHVRLLAYVYLMRDDYPPFNLSDERYPVVVETHPGPLNRWAVLFRIVLALPVLIVVNWLSFGVTISLIVVWIVVLAKGRMPGMLAQALGAVIRYEARTYGYTMLLTPEYPVGLYGDKDPYAEIRASGLEVPGAAAPDAPPRTARLHLGVGAKRLVTLFLVIGVAYNVANNVLTWQTDEQDLSVPTAAVVAEPPPSGE
jgi:hypothetical protein